MRPVLVGAAVIAALVALDRRSRSKHEQGRQWLDEVTRPPQDARLSSAKEYSGVIVVNRNKPVRSVLFEHRHSEERPVITVAAYQHEIERVSE